MLRFDCVVCRKEIEEPGALLFSPPDILIDNGKPVDHVHKFHICKKCYKKILDSFII